MSTCYSSQQRQVIGFNPRNQKERQTLKYTVTFTEEEKHKKIFFIHFKETGSVLL